MQNRMGTTLEKYSHNLPSIDIDLDKGLFRLSGISNIDNATAFEPTFEIVREYIKRPQNKTEIICQFEYFNTATSRILMEFFELFEKAYHKGADVVVQWYFKEMDIDMKDSGALYEELSELPFVHHSY